MNRRDGEGKFSYIKRLTKMKRETKALTYTEWANRCFGYAYSKDVSRRMFYGVEKLIDVLEKDGVDDIPEEILEGCNKEMSINSDGTQTSNKLILMTEENCKDVNFMLSAHGFDSKSWELVNARNNIWNVYSKKDGVGTLYSSKITVKPLSGISLEEINEHFELMSKTYKTPKRKKREVCNSGLMLEVPIMDLHLGKMAHDREVGDTYNIEKARGIFNEIIDGVIEDVGNKKFEKVIFPIGNDFFNFNNVDGTTTHGTKQDNDVKWKQLFKIGVEMLVDGITKLSDELKAPVEVFYVQGNHDTQISYYATFAISSWFRNDENVSVEVTMSPRKYVEYGNTLIGFSHGDKEKKRIDTIMQVEARESWGRTKYHEWHLAHFHSEQTRETGGVIVRHISSPTGSDTWHCESGYVGAIRKCQCFIWDKEYGLKTIFNIVI